MSTCPRSTPALRPPRHPRWSPPEPGTTMGSPGGWRLKAWLGSSAAICGARSLLPASFQLKPPVPTSVLGGGHSFVVEQLGETLERKEIELKTPSVTHNFKIKCRLYEISHFLPAGLLSCLSLLPAAQPLPFCCLSLRILRGARPGLAWFWDDHHGGPGAWECPRLRVCDLRGGGLQSAPEVVDSSLHSEPKCNERLGYILSINNRRPA